MNPPSNAAEVDSWYNSLSNSEKEQLFKCIPDKMLKCRDPAKRAHLEMCWKPELSDDIDLLKYEEHESGLFYECPSILEYIRDCRLRQETHIRVHAGNILSIACIRIVSHLRT